MAQPPVTDYTVEESELLWCPFVRVCSVTGPFISPAANRHRDLDAKIIEAHPSGAHCIADKCAMWRWTEGKIKGNCGLAR